MSIIGEELDSSTASSHTALARRPVLPYRDGWCRVYMGLVPCLTRPRSLATTRWRPSGVC